MMVPLGPVTYSPGKCTRLLEGDKPCLKEAVLHVFWDNTVYENGFTCAEHVLELDKWKPYSTHTPSLPPCGFTGSRFFEVVYENGTIESWCDMDEGENAKEAETKVAVAV